MQPKNDMRFGKTPPHYLISDLQALNIVLFMILLLYPSTDGTKCSVDLKSSHWEHYRPSLSSAGHWRHWRARHQGPELVSLARLLIVEVL
jgi:hypothetical protein